MPFLKAQNISYAPFVKNYTKQVYSGGTQTWDICEGDNGLIFFANNNGLLLFDGKQFQNFPMPKKTILRSIYFQKSTHRIYAGGQNELGYFSFKANGDLVFSSLETLLPKTSIGFEDVWGIEEKDNRIFFQTSRQIFIYDGNKIEVAKPSDALLENMYKIGSQILVTNELGSIYQFIDNQFVPLILNTKLDISSILPYGDSNFFITTFKNGIYLLKDKQIEKPFGSDQILKDTRIYRAISYGKYYVLGTNRAGVFFVDSSGNIINSISIKDGLQNNNVLSLFKDQNNNIWLGLDNGIDLLRLNYPFGSLLPDGLLKGTGYCMAEFGNYNYFGTNNGLYCRKKGENSANSFQLVSGTEGQVWWVQEINGKLFASHHEGLFEINGTSSKRISDTRGCWKLIALKRQAGYYIMGTYNGLCLYKWENGSLVLLNTISRFKESSRFLEEDENGNIWVGHPYKGIYKIGLSMDLLNAQQVKLYGTKEGLPSETENYVFNTNMGLSFCTKNGIYKFLADEEKFIRSEPMLGILDSNRVYNRLFFGLNSKTWWMGGNEIGYIQPEYNGVEYSYGKIQLPKLDQNLVGGFEFLKECSDGHLFIGVEAGFVHINLQQIKDFKQVEPKVLLTSVASLSNLDSIYYRYIGGDNSQIIIKDRSIELSYSSPNAYFFKDISFSSYLEGWDKTWSAWKSAPTREFSRLSYGTYTFHIKARYMGLEGPETKIKIVVKAPWYWTGFAKFVYSLIAILILLLIGFFPQMLVRKKASRIIAQKDDHFKRQTEQLRQEKESQEKELIELKNQQLQVELDHQGRELASSTMHIVQKSEMLLSIKDKLKHISSISNDPKIKPEINELIKNIEKDTLIDRDWEKFELYFNNIHDKFTLELKDKFPQLSANDIKMCAYLRMNLSTKEIASILNISVRGVEISRYRLRKKMELENGTNLTEYLSKL